MFNSKSNKNVYFLREETQNKDKEKKWDERFFLDKIPPYDAYKDVNYLSLGLMKSKIRYEYLLEKEKLKKIKSKNPLYSEHYLLESQPKTNITNKKLVFSVENYQDKNKINDYKKYHSLTYSHHHPNRKKNYIIKSINQNDQNNNSNNNNNINNYKYQNNYITNYLSANNKNEKNNKNQLSIDESDLLEEFEIIKVMWSKFGVTKKYQENFVNFINSLEKKDSIRQFLLLEKKQMQKFKYDLTQLLKKIIHRNDEVNNLKQLIKLYSNILNEKKFYHEKENENLENLSVLNEKKVISDINQSLLTVRVNTINVINQIKNFSFQNSYYFYMNKIDLNKIKNDYYYNDEYLLSIKNDLDFVQNPEMQNLYDFQNLCGNDPFFLSFTKFPDDSETNRYNKLKLPISEKMLIEIQNCLFFLYQAEICIKTKNNNIMNKNKIINFLNNNSNNDSNDKIGKNNEYGIGSLFKGNLERNIIKLKMQRGYNKIFTFMGNTSNSSRRTDKIKSLKKKNDIPLMTSQELKDKFNEYESINNLISEYDENKDDKNDKENIDIINEEEEFKKRDEEIMFQKIKHLEKEMKGKEELKHSKKAEEDNYQGELEHIKNQEKKEKENNEHIKEEERKRKEEEEKLKKEEEERLKKEEEEKRKKEEEEKIKKEEKEKLKREEEKKKIEEMNKNKSIKSEIEEDINGDGQNKDNNEEKKEIETYDINWFTGLLEEIEPIYSNYLPSIPQYIIDCLSIPEKIKDLITGIYPKIIIAKKNTEDNNKIYGICCINNYIDNNDELVLKINHISAIETNIINRFIDLIDTTLKNKTTEIIINNINKTSSVNNELCKILSEKGFKEYNKNENKIILRKENTSDNNNELGTLIKYDSLSILTLRNKIENNEDKKNNNEIYTCFNSIINEINMGLLINSLKINDKYKIEIANSSFESSLVGKISKLENIFFDFIESKNNECLNINEISNNEILPEENHYYSMIKNFLSVHISTLMSLNIDGYLYNGIKINIKHNIIPDVKYSNNLFYLPTLNKNVFIIIYQYNSSFENDFFKNKINIYNKFTSLFKDSIKNFNLEENKEDESDNNKILWIPSFSLDTNLFSSKLSVKKDINIKNGENVDMSIQEYNEFLKINYFPDNNIDKSVKININNKDNIIIKDKFILGICHKMFMDNLDIPIISLINVTCENFIKP